MKFISALKALPYESRLRKVGVSAWKREGWESHSTFQGLKGASWEAREGLFTQNCSDRTWSNGTH